MEFEPSRLRRGEVIAGTSALVLLALTFLAPWYAVGADAGRVARAAAVSTSVNGWDGLTTLRWLILLTIVAALALAVLQGTRQAPALPVSLSVIVTVLGAVTSLALIYRVLIDVPGPEFRVDPKPGAYLGLISALTLACGAFWSLRVEDPPDASGASVRTVELARQS